jgi:hypothetical protein
MPKVNMPDSRFLNPEEWKKVLKNAKTPIEKELVFLTAPIEAKNPEMLQATVYNKLIGEKELCEYKSKFREFFDAYTQNTDGWVGMKIEPVMPSKETNYFTRFIIPEIEPEEVK